MTRITTAVVLASFALSGCNFMLGLDGKHYNGVDGGDAGNDSDTDSNNDTATSSDADTDADSDMDSDSDMDGDADNDSDSDADADTDSDSDTDVDSDSDSDGDTGTVTEGGSCMVDIMGFTQLLGICKQPAEYCEGGWSPMPGTEQGDCTTGLQCCINTDQCEAGGMTCVDATDTEATCAMEYAVGCPADKTCCIDIGT